MTQTGLDIERVVREVLAELNRAQASAPAPKEPPPAQASKPTNGELVLSMRLVTMDEIQDKLAGIRRLVVAPQAVVTPAVRDVLRQRDITLSRGLPEKNASTAALRLVVVAARSKFDPQLLAGSLQAEGIEIDCRKIDCILAATDQLAAELAKGDALGMLLTPHTAAALCLANRLARVRAVLGAGSGNLQADLRAVGANLLVADPQGIGLFKLARMAGDFYRGGLRACPEVFRKRLM
jgi:hypothetical protein